VHAAEQKKGQPVDEMESYQAFRQQSYLPKIPSALFALCLMDLWRNDEIYAD